ncbi:amidase signature domain-containing protein [Dactylonectria estremocensis]|uniref:Amidase signature domain-containing protein n=1 Tax=Dactylonectria estremocensis TaxID=1079267 RepID=A0A9P9IME0_9HYPO|nr:amidase signature domain-containing protein [Dactylonectria estremocensis]
MSIVSLANDTQSSFSINDLHELAAGLGFKINDDKDAKDYHILLRSLQAVMQNIKDGPDYLHPALEPYPVLGPRTYWNPQKGYNPMNAWSHQCDLKAEASNSDSLLNRTVAIKDNISVGGLPTTLGTLPTILSEHGVFPISTIDATVVSRILAAGARIKGTSTCESFCASPLSFTSATGPVHNARLHGYTSGGSSSGSCALVAAGVLAQKTGQSFGETVQLAIGSDQAGSVRIPACFSGIYGLKPTFGLIPYTGAASMTPMIDHLGPIGSTLEDIAALLKVMAGYDGLDPRMTPESPLVGNVKDYPQILADFRRLAGKDTQTRRMRVGLLKESFTIPGISPQVREMVQRAAKAAFGAVGVEVIEVSIPMHLEGPTIWTASTRPSMSDWLCQGKPSGHLSYLPPHIQARWPPTQETYQLLTSNNPAVVNIMLSQQFAQKEFGPALEAKAHRKAFELRAAYDKALAEVDVLITPCAPTVAMPHPPLDNSEGERSTILEKLGVAVGVTNNTCPFNITGHPALSVPCGFGTVSDHPDVALPIGMQIIGKRWDDESVLIAAALFENGHRYGQRVPSSA